MTLYEAVRDVIHCSDWDHPPLLNDLTTHDIGVLCAAYITDNPECIEEIVDGLKLYDAGDWIHAVRDCHSAYGTLMAPITLAFREPIELEIAEFWRGSAARRGIFTSDTETDPGELVGWRDE